MNSYNIITHPLTQEKLSINSIEAKNLLKNYIKLYNSQQNGGSFLLKTIKTAFSNVFMKKKIPFSLHLRYNIDEQYKDSVINFLNHELFFEFLEENMNKYFKIDEKDIMIKVKDSIPNLKGGATTVLSINDLFDGEGNFIKPPSPPQEQEPEEQEETKPELGFPDKMPGPDTYVIAKKPKKEEILENLYDNDNHHIINFEIHTKSEYEDKVNEKIKKYFNKKQIYDLIDLRESFYTWLQSENKSLNNKNSKILFNSNLNKMI